MAKEMKIVAKTDQLIQAVKDLEEVKSLGYKYGHATFSFLDGDLEYTGIGVDWGKIIDDKKMIFGSSLEDFRKKHSAIEAELQEVMTKISIRKEENERWIRVMNEVRGELNNLDL